MATVHPHQIPRLFQVFPIDALIFIKPSVVYKQAYVRVLSGWILWRYWQSTTLLNSTRVMFILWLSQLR